MDDNQDGASSSVAPQDESPLQQQEQPIKTNIPGLDEMFNGGIPKGTSILLIAPPMIEVRLFCIEYIFRGLLNNDPGLIVTTDDSPENIKAKTIQYNWTLKRFEDDNILKWVDTYSINANKDVKSTGAIKRIGGPVALSDMAIAMSDIEATFFKKEYTHLKFLFDSLSTLLMYSNPETIYYFLQSVIPKLKNVGGLGIFTLSSGMHDSRIEMTIRHLMDATIVLDDEMNMKVLSFPTIVNKKEAKLNLAKQGFSVE